MRSYRDAFCWEEGFEHVSRYVTGLMISPNKTLQGIYDLQVWPEGKAVSRRTMYEAVFEAGWDDEELIGYIEGRWLKPRGGQGRQVISLDWTIVHHERGPKIYANSRAFDWVEGRMGWFQVVVMASVSTRGRVEGLEVVVQEPSRQKEEKAYLEHTAQRSYEQMAKDKASGKWLLATPYSLLALIRR